ncbi:hypothetical protein BGX31_001147 [Mortierella sp. GBA43]|nr:hypothetical protein BGX31_001147 [Mortierella sp. GBA43]
MTTTRTKKFKDAGADEQDIILQTARTKLLTKLRSMKSVPRGGMQEAYTIIKDDHNDPEFTYDQLQNLLRTEPKGIDIWKQTVDSEFDSSWTSKMDEEQDKTEPEQEDVNSGCSKDIRTCTVSLSDIIRHDMKDERPRIIELAAGAQKAITDTIDELSCIAMKTVCTVASGELYGFSDEMDVLDLLPFGFEPRRNINSKIKIARIPKDLQDQIVSVLDPDETTSSIVTHPDIIDMAHILTQSHLQHLHTRFLGPNHETAAESQKDHHQLWKKIDNALDRTIVNRPTPTQPGISRTVTEHIREFSTSNSAIFITRNRFAVLERTDQTITIRDLQNNSTKSFKTPTVVNDIFYAGTGQLLLSTPASVILDMSYVALLGKHTITIATKSPEQTCLIRETIRIKSVAWDESGILVYTTLNHIKYAHCQGDSGIIRTLEQAIYLTRVKGKNVYCPQPRWQVSSSTTRILWVRRFIAYLQKKGYLEIALQFVRKDKTRFELAQECGNLEVELETAKVMNKDECWDKLAQEALRQGNHQIVEMCYQRGNTEKLSKMLKIAELRGDAMLRFHNSLLLGNVEERIRLLREVGQEAEPLADSWGMDDDIGAPAVEHRGASLAPIESHGLDLEGDGRWDLDADLAAELHGETGAIVAEDCGLTILVAGQSEAEIWCRNSPLAADHVAAGAFESAIQAPQLVGVCREYILGLSIELVRRETQNDTSPAGIKRMLELAAYFTTVELQPKHMLVSLRTAMTASYKHKNL